MKKLLNWFLKHDSYVAHEDEDTITVKCLDCDREVEFEKDGGSIPNFINKGDQSASHSLDAGPFSTNLGAKK